MGVLRLVAPATYPVGIAEVRLRLKIDDTVDDVGVNRLIAAATRAVENKTQRALITQTWEFIFDAFPGGSSCYGNSVDNIFIKSNSNVISFPLPPLQSVDSIKYIDVDGVEQTLAEENYAVDRSRFLGALYPAYGKTWPATRSQPQAVRVEFTAGYGEADDVEPDLVLAILLLIGHYDLNREAVSDRQTFLLPEGVDSLLSAYVVPSIP
ncbi:MAG: head-tail connector protein [Pseudomonadota bacterium]